MTPEYDSENSRGIILIVVLWTVTMMTVIVVALSAFAQKNLSLAGVDTTRLRTEFALQSGLDVAEAMIVAKEPDQRAFFDGTPTNVDVGGGRLVEVSVLNTAGLVDINRAPPELITGLLEQLDFPDGEVKTFVDAITKARQVRTDAAGKGSPNASSGQPQQTTQQQTGDGETPEAQAGEKQPHAAPAFFSINQLYGLKDVKKSLVDKILPLITLYTPDGKVNPMAAPETVLMAIPEISPGEVSTLMAARERHKAKDPEVENILAAHQDFLAIAEGRTFLIEVKALDSEGVIAGSRLEAVVINDEAGGVPFQNLAWSW